MPEIKFDSVQGRIINVINTIITVKCKRSLGEFNGIKCFKKLIGKTTYIIS